VGISLPSWLAPIGQSLQRAKQSAVRMATTNPVVAPILKQYRTRVPEPVRRYINPRLNPLSGVQDIAGLNSLLFGRNEPTATGIYAAGLITPVAGTIAGLSQLGGDTPQADTPYGNWRRLGYKSENDMRLRVAQAQANENARALIGRLTVPGAPAFVPPAAPRDIPESLAAPSTLEIPRNPVDASTRQVGTPAPQAPIVRADVSAIPYKAYEAAVTTGLAQNSVTPQDLYRAQEYYGNVMDQSGDLQSRLKAAGGAAGMTDEALSAWVKENPALAYREMFRREKLLKDSYARSAAESAESTLI
jgi:hypothetical protein